MTMAANAKAVTPQEEVEADDRPRVWNPRDMTREQFCLHMTLRHTEHIGNQRELSPAHQTPYTEELWRIFHERLHDMLPFLDELGMTTTYEEPGHVHDA